jgi:RNA polymerase sigma factor (sigma-70 family)
MNQLADAASEDPQDAELVAVARSGSREALELLVTRHQAWTYNIARRMTYNAFDAEDATQEILIKVITKLSAFEGRGSFRTWLYRTVVNHLLNMKRGRSEAGGWDFAKYAQALDATSDADIADDRTRVPDAVVLFEEAKISSQRM